MVNVDCVDAIDLVKARVETRLLRRMDIPAIENLFLMFCSDSLPVLDASRTLPTSTDGETSYKMVFSENQSNRFMRSAEEFTHLAPHGSAEQWQTVLWQKL